VWGNVRVAYADWLSVRARFVKSVMLFYFCWSVIVVGNVNRSSLDHKWIAQISLRLNIWDLKSVYVPGGDLEHHDYMVRCHVMLDTLGCDNRR